MPPEQTGVSEMYTYERLRIENEQFAGTGGISENNVYARFAPAFRDAETGRVELARLECGAIAPMHLLFGLPDEWVTGWDAAGQIVALRDSVVAGFVRDEVFYTRDEAAQLA